MSAEPNEPLPVEPADTHCVAAIIRHLTSGTNMASQGEAKARAVLEGKFDNDPVVQCAVRHRLFGQRGHE